MISLGYIKVKLYDVSRGTYDNYEKTLFAEERTRDELISAIVHTLLNPTFRNDYKTGFLIQKNNDNDLWNWYYLPQLY